ncbi:MAG TPA: AraC family transcriptional regulator [Armatimonadota bacterium]
MRMYNPEMNPFLPLVAHTGHTALKCPPDWQWDSTHTRCHGLLLWLIVQGHGAIATPDRTYALRAGDCFVLRMTERNFGTHDPRTPLVVHAVHFDFLTPDGAVLTPSYAELPRYRHTNQSTLLSQLMDQSLTQLTHGDMPRAVHWLRSALLLIDDVDRHPYPRTLSVKQAAQVDHICQMIRTAPEQHYTLADLARHCRCSEDHFSRLFRQYTNTTPAQFIIHARIAEAKKLLLFTENSVAEIAELLGYSSPYFFSRQFHQQVGVPPTAFRAGKPDGAAPATRGPRQSPPAP